jgi:hypothetical protein
MPFPKFNQFHECKQATATTSRAGDRQPSYSPKTRHGGLQRTSPSCLSCCQANDSPAAISESWRANHAVMRDPQEGGFPLLDDVFLPRKRSVVRLDAAREIDG